MLWFRFSTRRSARLHHFQHGAAWFRLTVRSKCGVVVYTRRLIQTDPFSQEGPIGEMCRHCLAVLTSEEAMTPRARRQ